VTYSQGVETRVSLHCGENLISQLGHWKDLLLQNLGECTGSGLIAKAGSLAVQRYGLKAEKFLPNECPHSVQPLGQLNALWILLIFCLVEKSRVIPLNVLNKGKALFDDNASQAATFYLPGVVEVVGLASINGVWVPANREESVVDNLEMLIPGNGARVQQHGAIGTKILHCAARDVTEPADQEEIGVLIDPFRMSALRGKVFDLYDSQTFDAERGEVGFMEEAESAGETKFPTQAVTRSRILGWRRLVAA
jgi:hypothetical protein